MKITPLIFGGVFGFLLDEDQRPVRNVEMALGDFLGPVFAHLRRRRDRIGTGGIRSFALDMDDGGVAIDRVADARILDLLGGLAGFALVGLEQFHQHDMLLIGNQFNCGSASCRRIFFAAAPLAGVLGVSNQTMAPVGHRSIGPRVAQLFSS